MYYRPLNSKAFNRFKRKNSKGNNQGTESIFKSVSNNYRIAIILLIHKNPGLNLEYIAQKLNLEYKNTSAHIHKLHSFGLIYKKYHENRVLHFLTEQGILMTEALSLFYYSIE